jgi:hypothetical protein
MGMEIVSWEGGDRLGWWGLEGSSRRYSVEFLWRLCVVRVLKREGKIGLTTFAHWVLPGFRERDRFL